MVFILSYLNIISKKRTKDCWVLLPTLLLILFGISSSFAQLSDMHYLPPLNSGGGAANKSRIYLSTPEINPFTVRVFQGNSAVPLNSFTLSNSGPQEWNISNLNSVFPVANDIGVKRQNLGLRFESQNGEPFYVNLRITNGPQAASLTCKGKRALGTHFKWGGVPNIGANNQPLSSVVGIMASEDGTTVNISGYDPSCVFRLQGNVAGITSNTLTINLDAGETFVVEARESAAIPANSAGWLGATITSNKDIAINIGQLLLGVVLNNKAKDAGMDQPVPVDRLGNEHIVMRGNGANNTEFPIVIATIDNTDIFVNGAATPIANIDEGEFYKISGANYNGTTAGANMHIYTTENVYVYQSLSGDAANNTTGLNFLPPVSCYLPSTVDHIPNIQDVATQTFNGGVTIIASSTTPNANITVTDDTGLITLPTFQSVPDGSTPANWKTVFVPGLTGDVRVNSSGPIAVGFFGVSGVAGVAGYFSGFDPDEDLQLNISNPGCFPGGILQIMGPAIFDTYQWYKNDINGNGVIIPGATFSTYNAPSEGYYYVEVSRGGCLFKSRVKEVGKCRIITNRKITYRVKPE